MCEDNQLKRKGIPILSEESSWSEDKRYRTPSGTVIPDKNDIRTFFKALQLRSDLPVKEIKIKSREVCSQLRSRKNLGDVHSSGTVKTKPIKHRKTVASRRKLVTPKQPRKSTGRTINTRSKTATSTRNSTFEGHQSSSMTEEEMFETPGSELLEEEQMIKYLASSIRSIPDENSSQLENQGATNEVDENAACVDKTPHNQVLTIIDQKLQKIANMATAAIDSPNENSPLQDEENPQVIGVPTVVQMFQELKEEIRALANQQHQCKAEVDVETLKSECCNKVEAALTIALKGDIEVVQKNKK